MNVYRCDLHHIWAIKRFIKHLCISSTSRKKFLVIIWLDYINQLLDSTSWERQSIIWMQINRSDINYSCSCLASLVLMQPNSNNLTATGLNDICYNNIVHQIKVTTFRISSSMLWVRMCFIVTAQTHRTEVTSSILPAFLYLWDIWQH